MAPQQDSHTIPTTHMEWEGLDLNIRQWGGVMICTTVGDMGISHLLTQKMELCMIGDSSISRGDLSPCIVETMGLSMVDHIPPPLQVLGVHQEYQYYRAPMGDTLLMLISMTPEVVEGDTPQAHHAPLTPITSPLSSG